ncbi:hypothetical protein AMK18_29970 [Streptomyces sp. CB01249]|nr:hypothetical protein AMK18_29970 [Streptomyces sp. CB01249]
MRDPAVDDGEDLQGVQPVPTPGRRRVRGERGLPVGGELPHGPAGAAHREHPLHEPAVVPAAAVPQRHRRHLQHGVLGQQAHQRGHVRRLERPDVPLDDRPHPGIVRLGDRTGVGHFGERGTGPLQRAVDRRDRRPQLLGNLGGSGRCPRPSRAVRHTLVAIRYSQVRTDARPGSYRFRAFHARSNVSCTRSSASWNEPSTR